jgi:hypothetical protein
MTFEEAYALNGLAGAAYEALGKDGHLFGCFGRPWRDDCTDEACAALRRALTRARPGWQDDAKLDMRVPTFQNS